MKYLITGVTGQLGYDILERVFRERHATIYAPKRDKMDLSNEASIREYINFAKPDVIFASAAYTKVDKAEDEINECFDINYKAQKIIKEEAEKLGSKLFYISTDYVFDGTKNVPYEVNDKRNPLNYYGKSKMMGEDVTLEYYKSFVVRTSWVFGINGNNFVKTMLRLSETKDELNVVNDQIGSPTYTVDLANLLVQMSKTDAYGIYHANNESVCSWAEFAEYIMQVNNKNMAINKITTDEFPQKAVRPKYSVLSKNCLTDNGFDLLPSWQDATERYSKELKKTLKR